MNRIIRFAGATMLALAAMANAQAATLAGDGSWQGFDVDSGFAQSGGAEWIDSDGKSLDFSFTIDSGSVGVLTVVDTIFAGDTFKIYNGTKLLGNTSAVAVGIYDEKASGVYGAADALNDPLFSRGTFTLGAGSYLISGVLDQSVLLSVGGDRLNATSGAISLSVSAVPEPETYALLLAGLGLLGFAARRRA